MATSKDGRPFPTSNLRLVGFGNDINGNRVIRLKYPNSRGFSIQTGGNMLPETDWFSDRYWNSLQMITYVDLAKIEKEIVDYIKKYGSVTQKKKLRIKN